jgi:hypothetical protein
MHDFSSFEWPAVQIWIFRRNLNKRTKSTNYRKHFSNCLKMVHVGLYSVGTQHKNFGWENKKNKKVICWVSTNDTRQSMLCRVPAGRHSAKDCKRFFVECQLDDTRQRTLCRVPAIWHSTKNILKFLKNLCRVPDHGHSAKKGNKRLSRSSFSFFSPLTLSVRSPPSARHRASPQRRLPVPPPPRARRAPPPCHAHAAAPAHAPHRRAPTPPRPGRRHAPRPPSAPTPPRLHAGIIFVALYNFCDIVFWEHLEGGWIGDPVKLKLIATKNLIRVLAQ